MGHARIRLTQPLLLLGVFLFMTTGPAQADPALLPSLDAKDFSTRILGKERHGNHAVVILQARARSAELAKKLGYTGIRSWFDTRDRVMLKVILLDDKDSRLKTIRFTHFEMIEGHKHAVCAEVTDHQQGKTGQIELKLLTACARCRDASPFSMTTGH